MGARLRASLLLSAAFAGMLFCWPRGTQPAGAGDATAESGEETNPLGANAACYVCHIPFVKDEFSKVHLKAKVTCIKCHGLSAAHANDENIGATKPDVVFKRDQIDRSCFECHKTHNVPARQVVARFLQRRFSRKTAPVCTECHGSHKIEPPPEEEKKKKKKEKQKESWKEEH